MILVIVVLNFILPGVVPKWAIFAPVFVPTFARLDVTPQTVLAAYRIGDSPTNVLTPLMVYLPFIVTIAQRYQRDAAIGTVIALMLPYTVILLLVWLVLNAHRAADGGRRAPPGAAGLVAGRGGRQGRSRPDGVRRR